MGEGESWTHEIVSMERGKTQGSGSPMWRCVCGDGTRVNVFQHADPKKNSFTLFELALFGDEMTAMAEGDILAWKAQPIRVRLTTDGKWWSVAAVQERADGAMPDAPREPNRTLWKMAVEGWALHVLITLPLLRIWDTETTGVTEDDEIVSIAVLNARGEKLFHSLVQPVHPERLVGEAGAVNGITPEMVQDAPMLPEIWSELCDVLEGAVWCGWNIEFDAQMLAQDCERHGLIPILPAASVDAMAMYARYHGEWDKKRQEFVLQKLSAAAEQMEIRADGALQSKAHDALADAWMTLELIRRMRG